MPPHLLALVLASALAFPAPRAASSPAPPPSLWGEHGHRMIGRVAAEALPEAMPAFFRSAADRLAYLNPEPDRWRDRTERDLDPALNDARSPEHYINLEAVPAAALAAPDRFAYADSLSRDDLQAKRAGLLPYQILELAQELRVGFRLWRAAESDRERAWIEGRILDVAGVLGHYVADASNPHHTTIHFNGWVGANPRGFTSPPGFHHRFETEFVEAHVTAPQVEAALTAPARDLGALRPAVWAYVADTQRLVERLYELDTEEPFGAATVGAAHERFAVERLAAGAAMLRDLWWTAWVSSASP